MSKFGKLIESMSDEKFDIYIDLFAMHREHADANGIVEWFDDLDDYDSYDEMVYDAVFDEVEEIAHYYLNEDNDEIPRVHCDVETWDLWERFFCDFEGNKKYLEENTTRYARVVDDSQGGNHDRV